jgi:hypothetical protein
MNSNKGYKDIHKNRTFTLKKEISVKKCESQIEDSQIKFEIEKSKLKVGNIKPSVKNSVKRMMKQGFIEWCNEATLHAIPNASRSKHKSHQILYIACFLISTGFCFSYIGRIIITYMRFDTITKMQIINETPSFFPTVSFCNLKMFNKEKSKSYLKNIFLDSNNVSIISQSKYGDNIMKYILDSQAIAQYSLSNDQSSSLKRNLGFELNETMISCTYNWQTCFFEDFKYFYHPLHGSCYSFNQDLPAKTTTISGKI